MTDTSLTPAAAAPGRPKTKWPLLARVGAVVFGFWVFIALFGGVLAPYSPGEFVDDWDVLSPISSTFPLGSDYLGRDVLSRVMAGAKYTVGVPMLTAALALLIGLVLGILATLFHPTIDAALSWLMDTVNSLPSTIFAMVAVAGFGTSISVLIVVITLLYIPSAYRNIRSAAINISRLDFAEVARVRGEGRIYIIFREILPNVIPNMLTHFGITFIYIALLLSGLSFLGLGIQPPETDWGAIVAENMVGLSYGAPAVFAPALCLLSLTVSMTFMVDAVSQRKKER